MVSGCSGCVGLFLVQQATRTHGDVRLDLLACLLHRLGEASDLEDRFLVPGGCDDVGVGLLLDALDGRALGTNHQAYHSLWHSHLDRHLPGHIGGWPWCH